MTSSDSFTPQEWSLINKVMDTVETLQRTSPTPVDVAKVKTLVLKTYNEHGNPASEALIDQAIAVATVIFHLQLRRQTLLTGGNENSSATGNTKNFHRLKRPNTAFNA